MGTENGSIKLVIIEGKDLIAADIRGTSNPYVKVLYGKLKKKTKVSNLSFWLLDYFRFVIVNMFLCLPAMA